MCRGCGSVRYICSSCGKVSYVSRRRINPACVHCSKPLV